MSSATPNPINTDIAEHLSEKNANLTAFLVVTAVAGLVIALLLLAKLINPKFSASRIAQEEGIVNRLRPVAGFELVPTATGPRTGQEVYDGLCSSCHGTGASGSPKFGDAAAWGSRIAQGFDTLFKHASEGFNKMPARGGDPNLSDLEVSRAIVFMANKGGASFPEPVDPAAKEGAKDTAVKK